MRLGLGDIIEWLAAAALIAGASVWAGWALGLVALAICLGYFAQCYDAPLPKFRRPRRPTPPQPIGGPEYLPIEMTCARCGETYPQGEPHTCPEV